MLEDSLHELGWVEGRNAAFEHRYADLRLERLPELAADLVRLKVDLIVAATGPAAHAAKQATATIPIVTVLAGSPVETGLIASLARPGGNVTGLTADAGPELYGKRLQLLTELAPRVSRVAVLWNAEFPGSPARWRALEEAARALRVTLQQVDLRRSEQLEDALASVVRGRAGALLVLDSPFTLAHRARIVDFAAKRRLPAAYAVREFVDAGGLLSYGTDLRDLFRRAATHVDKILKGARPADLPVEQPTRFELVLNETAARALGITFPQSLLFRADHVIR